MRKEKTAPGNGKEAKKPVNRNFFTAFRKAYPLVYRPVWKENLLLSFVDIFHGLSFAAVVILTQRFFDSVAGGVQGTVPGREAAAAAAALILCQIASQLLNGFVNFYADVVREKGYGQICAMLQEKIGRLRPVDFEKNSFLTDLEMAGEGAKDACEMVDTANSIVTFYVPYFALMGAYMLRLDGTLLVSLLLVFLPVLASNLVNMHFGDRIERQIAPARRSAEAYERVLTGLDCYRENRVLGAAAHFLRLYRESAEKWNRTAWKYRKKEAAVSLILNGLSFLAYGGILLLLVWGCLQGRISVGAFAAVFSSIDVMFLLMDEIFRDSLGSLSQNMGRVNNFLNLMESPESRRENIRLGNGSVRLCDVSFRYPEADRDCLRHIDFSAADGETVAVVGENGAGKSTLARILLGLYPPQSGSVFLGGERIDENTCCFSSVSAVFQNFNRYPLSLEENIRISDLNSRESWQDALREADGRWEEDFPIDPQTILSRDFDGIDLSGGQWQRIAIARGIYRNAKLLLMDEPTAAIDPQQESSLYQTFLRAAKGRTCILITHRLGLARIADRIVVLKDGRVAETGSHSKLLEKNGEYRRMWDAQAGWYQEKSR